MKDLKQFLKLDGEKVTASLSSSFGLGKLSNISNDPEYWIDLFSYKEERSNIESFLLFRTASAFNLYKKGNDDPDSTAFAMNYLKEKLSNISSVQSVTIGKEINSKEKYRTLHIKDKNGSDFLLESDTGISLMSDLGGLFRIILKEQYGEKWHKKTYVPQYHLPPQMCHKRLEPFRNFFFYSLVHGTDDNILRVLCNQYPLVKECINELERRASYCHTPQNLILVPYGYNSSRGTNLKTYKTCQKIDDRIDLTLLDLDEMVSGNIDDCILQNRLGNQKSTMKSVHFLHENKEFLFPIVPNYDNNAKGIESILVRTRNINNLFENN